MGAAGPKQTAAGATPRGKYKFNWRCPGWRPRARAKPSESAIRLGQASRFNLAAVAASAALVASAALLGSGALPSPPLAVGDDSLWLAFGWNRCDCNKVREAAGRGSRLRALPTWAPRWRLWFRRTRRHGRSLLFGVLELRWRRARVIIVAPASPHDFGRQRAQSRPRMVRPRIQ